MDHLSPNSRLDISFDSEATERFPKCIPLGKWGVLYLDGQAMRHKIFASSQEAREWLTTNNVASCGTFYMNYNGTPVGMTREIPGVARTSLG